MSEFFPDIAGRPTNVCVLGLGQMGLLCASLLTADERAAGTGETPEPKVTLWGHSQAEAGALSQTRTSDRLPGFRLAERVRITDRDADLASADLVVVAVPAQAIREVLERLKPHLRPGVPLVSVAKGIENRTLMRPTEVICDILDDRCVAAVMSGPTIATELARCLPATMIAASPEDSLARGLQQLFSTSYLRIYTNPDVVGVELAGATKNVIAIAAGILDGLNAGYNAKSALLARGLAEITRLGVAMGADLHTFFGVAGVGDLATTCFSPEGRNRSCGEALGRGVTLQSYLSRSKMVVEGVSTCRSVVDLARRHDVDMPITETVHDVLFEELDPLDGISRLMSREPRDEAVGRGRTPKG